MVQAGWASAWLYNVQLGLCNVLFLPPAWPIITWQFFHQPMTFDLSHMEVGANNIIVGSNKGSVMPDHEYWWRSYGRRRLAFESSSTHGPGPLWMPDNQLSYTVFIVHVSGGDPRPGQRNGLQVTCALCASASSWACMQSVSCLFICNRYRYIRTTIMYKRKALISVSFQAAWLPRSPPDTR